jgi:hypothetical protein
MIVKEGDRYVERPDHHLDLLWINGHPSPVPVTIYLSCIEDTATPEYPSSTPYVATFKVTMHLWERHEYDAWLAFNEVLRSCSLHYLQVRHPVFELHRVQTAYLRGVNCSPYRDGYKVDLMFTAKHDGDPRDPSWT